MQSNDRNKLSESHHWLNAYNLSVWAAIAVGAVWSLIFLYVSASSTGDYLNAKIADPINFRMRDLLGKSPAMSQRLKIYAFDDKSFADYGLPSMTIDTWAEILEAIVKQKPKLVVIDAMFSDHPKLISPQTASALLRIKNSKVPVVTGAFATGRQIVKRNGVNMAAARYSLDSYTAGTPLDASTHMPAWQDRSSWFAYGPSAIYENWFERPGHILLSDEKNKLEPFLWLGGSRVIPHISMYAADSIKFVDRNLVINGRRIALNQKGEIPVNFVQRAKVDIYSLINIIDKSKQAKAVARIAPDDVVVLLPLYYTGNVDMRPSPYGWVPGGMYNISMINSVLNGDWLQPVMVDDVLIVIFVVIAACAAFYLTSAQYWLFFLGSTFMAFIAAQLLFAYAGLVVPYLLPIMAGCVAGISVFLLKVRKAEGRSLALHVALDGAVSPRQMEDLVRSPERFQLEPRERIVTLMFIDIVGFSMSSESMLPRVAFDCLKGLLSKISDVVHAHNGVVDKTLGDGLLCYFGYRFDTDVTVSDHSEKAVRCGIAIQELLLVENLLAARSKSPIYPLRIGINTASCYLGDLGSGHRIEFTVVGNGVNFAKRLEAACATHCLMIGATTADLVNGISFGECILTPKMIKIKHHAEPLVAWEINPFLDRSLETAEIDVAFRELEQYRRATERIVVNDFDTIIVTSEGGPAQILNFSGTGVNLRFEAALPHGTVLVLTFESRVAGLSAELHSCKIENVQAEVCWSYASTSGFAHGLRFKNLSSQNQKDFVRLISEYTFREDLPKVSGAV
jgi:class 3 adenylate cyclase